MRPSFAFEKGVLHIAAPGTELRIRWNPVPLAEHRVGHGPWMAFRPDFRILAPESPTPVLPDEPEDRETVLAKHKAFCAFRAEIAPAIIEVTQAFGNYQWPLMLLVRECKAGMDLARSNPALAYALANNEHFRATPVAAALFQAVRYSHRKQRHILEWLGFPESEPVVKILRKVPAVVAHPGTLRVLRTICSVPETVKQMGRLPAINRGIIFLLRDKNVAKLTTPELLQKVARDAEEMQSAPTADLLADIHDMASGMELLGDLRPFASQRRIRETYDRLYAAYPARMEELRRQAEEARQKQLEQARQVRRQQLKTQRAAARRAAEERAEAARRAEEARRAKEAFRASIPFPPPPIPGTNRIIPLRTRAALAVEGREQGNCLGENGDYAEKVMQGRMYLYKVLISPRCTLAIIRDGASWRISELKGRGNRMASGAIWDHVKAWLSANQVSL